MTIVTEDVAKINAYNTYATGAKSLDAPQVGAGFFMTPYNPQMWKADPSMNTNGMGSFMISAQQMIMNPKKLNANSDYMKSMSGVETQMKGSMRNELYSMAKMSYYGWVVLKRKTTVLKESEGILKYLIESTELRYKYGMDKLNAYYNGDLQGKTIAIWGLAFKPETDDMREATSLVTIELLLKAGCQVRVFDPVAMEECERRIGNVVAYATDMYDAALNADALLLITEWKQFRLPSWGVLKKTMNKPLLIDGRNIYDPTEMKQIGFDYSCIGR